MVHKQLISSSFVFLWLQKPVRSILLCPLAPLVSIGLFELVSSGTGVIGVLSENHQWCSTSSCNVLTCSYSESVNSQLGLLFPWKWCTFVVALFLLMRWHVLSDIPVGYGFQFIVVFTVGYYFGYLLKANKACFFIIDGNGNLSFFVTRLRSW